MSAECQQLNRLFSQCVDGNRIKIPQNLESPPERPPNAPPFILDILHEAARLLIQAAQKKIHNIGGYSFEALELLLGRENVAMSEFELIKLTYRWCRKNNAPLREFLHLFDLNILTAGEKAWTMNQLSPSAEVPAWIFNALSQSNLIPTSELRQFKLDYPGLKWKRIYDSSHDRLASFLDTTARTLELFQRKLIVVQVDERLTLAIYIPQKVEQSQETRVDNRVRIFAFPHSRDEHTSHRLAVPTKMNYRLYCDSNVFQLFERTRNNSWVYIVKGQSDDSSYRNQETKSGLRKGRQATLDQSLNYDCRASIALDKFSPGLQQHVGRVNRNGVLGAEIYVISNRDVKSMQNLDLWLQYVDTSEVMPLLNREPKEYHISRLRDVDWSREPDYLIEIVKNKKLVTFKSLDDAKYADVFTWLLSKAENAILFQCFRYLVTEVEDTPMVRIQPMLDFLLDAPFLSVTFARLLSWDSLHAEFREILATSGHKILEAHILSANEMLEFVVGPFKAILSQIKSMSLTQFSALIELVSLTVRSPEIALDILLEYLEPRAFGILPKNPALTQHFLRNLLGIALDHIDEAENPQKPREELLDLKRCGNSEGYQVVESRLRIDAPMNSLATSDHVRLTVASSPSNTSAIRLYSMDALVESSEVGLARFRCFHPLPLFLENCSWGIQNCGSFVTSKAMFDAVHSLATNSMECCAISGELFGKSAAKNESDITASNYVAKESLNASQNAAVKSAVEYPLTCLQGPPGSGKTHTIVEMIKQLHKGDKKSRILVTAPTHNAVDNVMRKYLWDFKVAGAATPAIRVSTDVRKVADDLKQYTCDAMAGKEIYTSHVALKKARDQIKKCRLVFTTCIGAGLGLLRAENFDTVIIDEASQQTEAASLVPLVKGCRKAILVGDHVQKHAVLQQFDISLFERLYKQSSSDEHGGERHGNLAKLMLDTQYRMHESICKFSSDEFYDGKLKTGIESYDRPLMESAFPWPKITDSSNKVLPLGEKGRMIFMECSTPEDLGQKSKSNTGQVQLTLDICKLLCTPTSRTDHTRSKLPKAEVPQQQSIAVLTPYSRQSELLKAKLAIFSNVEVSSIDGFQGREADIVVFVTVRCNAHYEIGFLKDLRRMNVALTRARCAVIVLGHRATLTMGPADEESTVVWKRLLESLVELKIEGSSTL